MTQDPYEPYEEEGPTLESRRPRRSGFAIDLTGVKVRLFLTVLVIGMAAIILYLALRPNGEPADVVIPSTPTAMLDTSQPIPTFTPGPTSTPPPLDEPTPAATSGDAAGEPGSGVMAPGARAIVTGTGGTGVNMRTGSGTSSEVLQILADETPLTLLQGPVEAEGFMWWQVRLEDGTEGWVVADYLAPAP